MCRDYTDGSPTPAALAGDRTPGPIERAVDRHDPLGYSGPALRAGNATGRVSRKTNPTCGRADVGRRVESKAFGRYLRRPLPSDSKEGYRPLLTTGGGGGGGVGWRWSFRGSDGEAVAPVGALAAPPIADTDWPMAI